MVLSKIPRKILQVMTVLLACLTFSNCYAAQEMLPKPFQGLWVVHAEHDACSAVKFPSQATTAGEGAIALDGSRYFSQETSCNVAITSKACCDLEGVETRGGTITCGKTKAPVIFRLQSAGTTELIVATYRSDISGPSIEKFVRCK